MSPGMRGKRVSSMRMPTVKPYWLKPPRTRPVVVIEVPEFSAPPSGESIRTEWGRRGWRARATPGSDWQTAVVGPEGLPVEGLVEPRAREVGEAADTAIAEAGIEAPRARVVRGREEDEMVRDPPSGRFGRGHERGSYSRALAPLGHQEETQVGRAGEDPARKDPGHADGAAVRRRGDDHVVARPHSPGEGANRPGARRAIAAPPDG